MKVKYSLIFYVDISIVKLNFFASVLSSDDAILIDPFKNDYDGFYLLLSKLDSINQDSLIIGFESATYYGDYLVRFLLASDLKVCVINIIITSIIHKNNVRKTKTDKVDTYIIAKTLVVQDNMHFMSMNDQDYIEHKELGRFSSENRQSAYLLKNIADFLYGTVFP